MIKTLTIAAQLSAQATKAAARITETARWLSTPTPDAILSLLHTFTAATNGAVAAPGAPYSTEPYLYVGTHSANVTVSLHDLPSLTDPTLMTILGSLEGLDPTETGTNDTPSVLVRSFHYKWTEGPMDLSVMINAFVRDDSDACKRVIIGYTDPAPSAPTPIYKLECSQ